VLWEPEGYWAFGSYFKINFIEFGAGQQMQTFTVTDYIDADNKLKPLSECETDNKEALERFLKVGARLELRSGAVRLVLSQHATNMPFSATVEVEFLPTLAVNNVTEDNAGGTVMVNGVGTASSDSDGVPDLGGRPYVMALSVYGKPDEGYKVDWDYIVIRNLNDLEGEHVFVKPDADGYFTTQLKTQIADKDYTVEKTGRVTEGSIIVELDGLPVPLQIDLRFVPDNVTDDDKTDDKNDDGTLPKTGVDSILDTLVLGLITSLAAGTAVALVILRQSRKEKKFAAPGCGR